jgi:phosphoribosylformylglycinamidine synthase
MPPAPAPQPLDTARTLGLTDDEYDRIVATLGREPSSAELGTYSVMWSEHCSYKSSRRYLRTLPTEGEQILVGPGENAGVVDVGGGQAVAFKIESHNHPSFVEPFQGAATGVGGILRDILTMGARPIALLDPLRFGDPADPGTRRVVDGVVRGIGHYGNAVGVPVVGGELAFDPAYGGNPLVNVLCVGVLAADRIQLARAERAGDVAVLIGQRTGRDGIGGASVLASAEFASSDPTAAADSSDPTHPAAKRPNVQVGDPFAGKLLIESCLELYEADVLSGIQDMGAAGIACSTAEMASAAGLGMRVDLDLVPLREPSMEAWEILASESQERMLALVSPERLAQVLAICDRWGVQATAIGEVTEGDRLVFSRGGAVVHDAPAASLTSEGPVYDRPVADWSHPGAGDDVDALPEPSAEELGEQVRALLGDPGLGSARWVTEQYDSLVGSATVAGPGGDAAVLRLPGPDGDPSVRGVAVATDGNGRWCALDPGLGARLVVAEAARNVACTGATPVAATNNLNFGSPERPPVMGAFRDVVAGIGEACSALGTPITGGNVSFYNATGDADIPPTPVLGVLGVLDDVTRAVGPAFRAAGDAVLLLGAPTRPGLGGSQWLWATQARVAGRPPALDLEEERALQAGLVALAGDGLLASAHDIAAGGLVATLAESCVAGGLGVRVAPEAGIGARMWLCSESPSRVVVSTADPEAVAARCSELGVGVRRLGTVAEDPWLVVQGVLALGLDEVRRLREESVPQALGLLDGS